MAAMRSSAACSRTAAASDWQSTFEQLLIEGCSAPRHELVLRFILEIAAIVALVQLTRQLAVDAIDHGSALYSRPLEERVSPALDVLVVLSVQELGSPIEPAFRQPAIPGKDGHVGDRVGAACDVLTLRQATVEHVELAFHLHSKPIDCVFDLLWSIRKIGR